MPRCLFVQYNRVLLLLISLLLTTACATSPSVPRANTAYVHPDIDSHISWQIIYATTQFPESANPLFASSTADFALNSALWAQPVFYDQQFHVHPDQLTEVPLPENGGVQEDGKIHLRSIKLRVLRVVPINSRINQALPTWNVSEWWTT